MEVRAGSREHGARSIRGSFFAPCSLLPALCFQASQIANSLGLRKPDDLERMIAGQQAVLIVVDRFARTTEEAGGRVAFVAENYVGVRFAALQSDADGHLAHRAAG